MGDSLGVLGFDRNFAARAALAMLLDNIDGDSCTDPVSSFDGASEAARSTVPALSLLRRPVACSNLRWYCLKLLGGLIPKPPLRPSLDGGLVEPSVLTSEPWIEGGCGTSRDVNEPVTSELQDISVPTCDSSETYPAALVLQGEFPQVLPLSVGAACRQLLVAVRGPSLCASLWNVGDDGPPLSVGSPSSSTPEVLRFINFASCCCCLMRASGPQLGDFLVRAVGGCGNIELLLLPPS
mmetsp:Transcript_65476/g.188697  ORF Transcript_65476/g.188697 Transcript_65476/m.188697 type:complete len:238 (-) Transcript_65476:1930-2643(-)